jgi:hypothetical protein
VRRVVKRFPRRLWSGLLAPCGCAQALARWLLVPVLAFALVALLAGFLSAHDARAGGYFDLLFSDPIHLKAWFATAALTLAVFQLFTAAWIFGRLPWRKTFWVNPVHRWSGRLAFVAILPVAYHCIFKLGFQSGDDRVMWHSLFGCFVFGAFAAKVIVVRLRRFPRFVLPLAGGILFTSLVVVWWTHAGSSAKPAGVSRRQTQKAPAAAEAVGRRRRWGSVPT